MINFFNKLSLLTLIALAVPLHADSGAFCSPQVIAEKIPHGYTWTLSSRMGAMLIEAEKRFGARDKAWTLLGVDFTNDPNPSIWYPFSGNEQKMIGVMLTRNSAKNEKKTLFQLSHEVIHILSPVGPGRQSTVFEEGLATWFSVTVKKPKGLEVDERYIGSKKYFSAYQQVKKLYQLYPDSDQRIRKLRTEVTSFTDLTVRDMVRAFPELPISNINTLLKTFDYWQG